MSSTPTVIASLTRALIDYGASRGLDRGLLVRSGGIDPLELEAKDGRVPRSADVAVWQQLCAALGPHSVGLDFAATRPGPRAYGIVALRDMTADTFGDALRRHCKHHRVIKDDVSALLFETRESSTIVLSTHASPLESPPAMSEAALAPYAIHAREWTGADVTPVEVCFEHAAPVDASRYEETFRCPIRFSQSVTSIRFAREVLDLPLVHAQRDVCDFLESSVEDELAHLRRGDLAEIVYRAVSHEISRGDVTLATVARSLGLGVRTLQRRLKEDAVSYHDVVDAVRHHRALGLVIDADLTLAWISDHLGFSDPRAFRRAFARWTGMSPDAYRRLREATSQRRSGSSRPIRLHG